MRLSTGQEIPVEQSHVRTIAGLFLLFVNGALVIIDAVRGTHMGTSDLILHGSLLLASYLLISGKKLMDLLTIIKDRIPMIGGK